jgi:hypothetical protein
MGKLLAALLAALVLFTSSGCAWWNTKGKAIAKDVLDCSIEALRTSSPELVQKIYGIFNSQPEASWGSALATLEASGWDALACAAYAVWTDLTTKQAVAKKGGFQLAADQHAKKAAFLKAWLVKKGHTFGFKAGA